MGAQDVERERAQPGDDAGLAPDAAGVLAERAVADVVVAVLDAPMAADGRSASPCIERYLAGVVGDLAPLPPQAGAGVPAQAAAGDARDAGDEGPPVGVEAIVNGEDLDPAMLLATMGVTVDGVEVIGWGLDGAPAGQAAPKIDSRRLRRPAWAGAGRRSRDG